MDDWLRDEREESAMTPSKKAVRAHLRHLGLEGKSPVTIAHREQALARLARALPVPLLDATAEQLYEWRAALPHSSGTIATYLSHVKAFYHWAAEVAGLLELSPAEAMPVPSLPRRFPRPIPEQDLMLALNSTTPAMRVRTMLELAAYCGLRACEIAGLRVENLRLRDIPPVIIVSAESAKGSRERVIELSPWMVSQMQAARLPLHGPAFPDANGQPLTAWAVSRICNDHLHGIGSPYTLHCLRHRFASQMYQATHDLRLVQDLLGHASQATTANYAAFSRAGATAAVASLPVPDAYPLQDSA